MTRRTKRSFGVGLCALNQSLEIAQCAVQGDYDELIRNNYDRGPPE